MLNLLKFLIIAIIVVVEYNERSFKVNLRRFNVNISDWNRIFLAKSNDKVHELLSL